MQEGLGAGRFGLLQGLMKAILAACVRLMEETASRMERLAFRNPHIEVAFRVKMKSATSRGGSQSAFRMARTCSGPVEVNRRKTRC